jgi:SAM-dependent methyltransferase
MNPAAYIEMKELEKKHWWFVGRRFFLKNILDKFLLDKNAKILEVGAGTGGNIELLNNYGKVTVLDKSDLALDEIRKNHPNIETLRCDFPLKEGIPFKDKYKLILMLDVLEHISDEQEALRQAGQMLDEGGVVVIFVPAYQFLFGPHDEHLHHLRRYSKKQLLSAVVRSGFIVQDAGYFNTILFPLAVLVRMLERFFKHKKHKTSGLPVFNSLYRFLFNLEIWAYKKMNFLSCYGLSVCVVFRQPCN